jgi:hypothetical protein
MLRRKFAEVFISDIKCIAHVPLLLFAILSPVIIALILLISSMFISDLQDPEQALKYNTVIAVSLISAVPYIYGLVFSFIRIEGKQFASNKDSIQSVSESRYTYFSRMALSGLSAFVVVLPVIYLTDAVSTEGWLRAIYISLLLATMAMFIYAFSTGSGGSKSGWRRLSVISLLFFLPVPFGLILHHPWNYFAFFSPFYWINWAWIIPSPRESLLYGLISIAIIVAGLIILYKKFLKGVNAK